MAFYSYVFSANYKGFKQKLKNIAKKENKSFPLMLFDTYYSIIKYGIGLTDYLNYEFYKKSKKERKTYAGIKIQDKFYEIVSPSAYKKRYTIKPDFLADFKKYTKRDFVVPEKDSLEEVKKFIKNHEFFMSKPYDGLGGAEVKKVYSKDIKNVEDYYEACKNNRIFLEEVVKQHKELDRLCKASCNTIRIMTFNNGGTPELKYPALDKDLNEYDKHPVSQVKFVGFEVPYFKEVKELVKQAALESDKILVVGWDIAVTDKGPVVIEGNRRPGFDVVQVASRKGRMDIISHVLDEYYKNNLNNK